MYLCLENDIGLNREVPDLSSRSARSLSVIWHFSIFLLGLEYTAMRYEIEMHIRQKLNNVVRIFWKCIFFEKSFVLLNILYNFAPNHRRY